MAENLTLAEGMHLFTQSVAAYFTDGLSAPGFLSSHFRRVVDLSSANVSWRVRRKLELVAPEVSPGSTPLLVDANKGNNKVTTPPNYSLSFCYSQAQFFLNAFPKSAITNGVNESMLMKAIGETAEELQDLRNMILRSEELQCAQIFNDGILPFTKVPQINFARKSSSRVAAALYWDDPGADPFADITAGCEWLRQYGKASGGTFKLILDQASKNALINNVNFKDQVTRPFANNINTQTKPEWDNNGGVMHGTLSCGNYEVQIWTLSDFYTTTPGGVVTQNAYIAAKTGILIPMKPDFIMNYAAVPHLTGALSPYQNTTFMTEPTIESPYYLFNYYDPKLTGTSIAIECAPLAVPVAVDQIYNITNILL